VPVSIQHLVVVSQTTLVATAPPSENVTAPETAPLYVSTTHKLEAVAPSAAPAQPAASIDCEAEVASFCPHPPASDGIADEEEPSDEALIAAAEAAERAARNAAERDYS